ncbi:MAG: DUF4293 domain-containing protein [Paludibacteraceae bacterium]|jgi:hypothetical protein|nr:DUF4293 domain-containing protein [Paludibacteraceae bacterium]MBQ3896656.1 DUF4293 domain-containing protein [Paludibacteraceae bacterium]MCM8871970.1 DUF4293 domain-containing protein [Paludibacteraceae bacterium]
MIQRIQTLYLFVVVVLFATMVATPLLDFKINNVKLDVENKEQAKPDVKVTKDVKVYQMTYKGIVDKESGDMLISTSLVTMYEIVVAVIALITIFLFKNRGSQIKLTVFNMVLQVGFYVVIAIYMYTAYKYAETDFDFHLPIVFPLISLILSYLAFRAIVKDDLLVKSLGRVR